VNEALWARAVHAAEARGLLPPKRASLTPRELAAEAAQRGEDRLALLVDNWYYPASYGHVDGVLSDEQAARVVQALEAAMEPVKAQNTRTEPVSPAPQRLPKPRIAYCDLCGRALTPSPQ